MITVGLSQHEINLITKILDEHKVEYHVDAAGGAENVHEAKVKGGRGDTSFYQIDIHDGQYDLLSASANSSPVLTFYKTCPKRRLRRRQPLVLCRACPAGLRPP